MGKASRTKGAVAEREVVALAIEHGFPEAKRFAPLQAGYGDDFPDVSGVGRLRIEVKRRGKGSMYGLAVAACRERPGEIPVLAYREDRGPWLAVLPLAELFKLERAVLAGAALLGPPSPEFVSVARQFVARFRGGKPLPVAQERRSCCGGSGCGSDAQEGAQGAQEGSK